jgi:alkylation response protein AidB-like acyl-CoA dehydrogenase
MTLAHPLSDLTDAELREHVVHWLRHHLPAGWTEAVDRGDSLAVEMRMDDVDVAALTKALGEDGLNCPTWPTEYFGLGLSSAQAQVIDRTLNDYRVPRPSTLGAVDFVGMTLGAATILAWGTEDQKQQYLYGLATGRDRWCQLFSEPGSGSDLASLATRAVRDGDVWRVNGQKVWSSGAHIADYGLLLARTDPDQPKHRGITYFIANMHAAGVQCRPLRQMTGAAEFNEVFLTDVEIPDEMRLGPVNEGWRVSTTTLMHERSGLSGAPQVGPGQVDRVITDAKQNGKWSDPVVRQRLMRLLIEERVLQMTNLRAYASGRAGRPPGAEGSITKLFSSALSQRISDAAVDVAGLAALAADGRPPGADWYEVLTESRSGPLPHWATALSFLASRSQTILGGTSEIQRNIIGERVLGLPKDLDPWKDRAWRDVPRG